MPGSHRFSIKRVLNSYKESIRYCLFFKKDREHKTQNVLNKYAKDNYQFFRYKDKKKQFDKLAIMRLLLDGFSLQYLLS